MRLGSFLNITSSLYSPCLFLSCSRKVYKDYISNIFLYFANLKMLFLISSNDKKFFGEVRPCDSVSRFFARFSFHSRSPSFLINVRTIRGLAVFIIQILGHMFLCLFFSTSNLQPFETPCSIFRCTLVNSSCMFRWPLKCSYLFDLANVTTDCDYLFFRQ